MIYHGDNYDNYSLDDLAAEVKRTVDDLRPYRKEFDCIAVTGMSGVVVGVPAALRLRKPVCILRKEKDGSHQGSVRNGWIGGEVLEGKRVLWIDDFVSGGATKTRIELAVAKSDAEVIGRYLYRDADFVLNGKVVLRDGEPV